MDKLVHEELVKLGVKIDNTGNVTTIVESVRLLENIVILPSASSELTKSKEETGHEEFEEKEADLSSIPRPELALIVRIRIRGKINIRIRFADPAALATAQLAQDRGSIFIRGGGGNGGGSIQIGGTIRFNAEKLNAVAMEGVEVLPAESPAELNLEEIE